MTAAFMKRLKGHFSNEFAVATPNGKLLSGSADEGGAGRADRSSLPALPDRPGPHRRRGRAAPEAERHRPEAHADGRGGERGARPAAAGGRGGLPNARPRKRCDIRAASRRVPAV